jgi:hypothetical protein
MIEKFSKPKVSPVNKPRISISEEGVTSVSVSEILLTDVAGRQLDALKKLIDQGLLDNSRSKVHPAK